MKRKHLEPQGWNWTKVCEAVERSDDTEVERLLGSTSILKYRDKNGNSLLHISADVGNIKLTKKYIDHGIKSNTINHLLETPLMSAAESNHLEIVKLLIESGAIVNKTRFDGRTALHFATLSANPAIINLLIKHDNSILNMMDWQGQSALHLAVRLRKYEIVELLINRGIDVDLSLDGYTALRAAVEKGDTWITERILAAGAKKIHHEFTKGATILHLVVWMKSVKITTMLLDKGVDISAKDNDGFTALHEAVISTDYDQVAFLIERGADVNVKSNDQTTPLHWAALRKKGKSSQDIMKLLLSRNSRVNERNYRGSTPLHHAAKYGTVEDIKLLTSYGADVSLSNYFGESLVYAAAGNNDPTLCRYLLSNYKLNVNKHCILGRYPLHVACKSGYAEVVTLLIEFGARINVKCISGKTPLHYAVYYNRNRVIEILLDHGADLNFGRNMMLKLAVERRNPVATRIMVKTLARREAEGVAISPLELKFIENKEGLLELLENCRAELRVMKERKVVNHVSFYRILVGCKKKVILGYVRNKELLKNFEEHVNEFPIYEAALKSNINWALHRDRFQQYTSSMLCEILPIKDPQHLIIQNVIRFLDEDDVPNWEKFKKK